jgi:DNA-binding CsgD family transcriptional regulator
MEPIQTPHGYVVFAANGQILYADAVARRLTLGDDGLTLTNGGLRARTARETAEVGRLLRIARPGPAGQLRRGGRMTIARGSRPPVTLLTLPLSSHWLSDVFQGCTLMLIIDGERIARLCDRALQDLYGLTPAEAALAVRIPGSRGLQKLADELKLSLSTVRTHLQRAFEKTGTHRQAELVQLLSELQFIGLLPQPSQPGTLRPREGGHPDGLAICGARCALSRARTEDGAVY